MISVNEMNDWIELTASLAETLIVVRLFEQSLDFKSKKWIWLKSTMFFCLLAAENILLGQRKGFEHLSALLFLMLVVGYVLLFFKGKLYERLLVAFFPVMTILPINLLVMNAFRVLSGGLAKELVEPGGSLRLPVLLFSKLAFFFACELLIHMRNRVRCLIDGFQWAIQLSCFAITFLITYLLWNISVEDEDLWLLFGAGTMIVVLNVLLYVIMGKMHRDSMIREEYRVLKMRLAAQEQFVGEARERCMEMRTLRHDMRHYLSTAAGMISEERADEARDYIETVLHEKVDQTTAGVDTGNAVVDAVINSRIDSCVKRGIRVKCMIDSNFGGVSDTDLSILLSNALDNAVRGCNGTNGSEIELTIGMIKSFTCITVKNTIAQSVLKHNPKLETDKPDKSIHGFGIASMRKIADKYGGCVEFREEGHRFAIEIWLAGIQENR